MPPRQVGRLKAVLQQSGCLLPGRSICCWESTPPTALNIATTGAGGLVAMHVTAEMAAVLNDPSRAAEAPQALAAGLRSGEVVWQSGVRLGSAACGGPRGKQCDSAAHLLREAVFSRPIWRPAVPAPRFCFVELFAGIGGFRLVRSNLQRARVFLSSLRSLTLRTADPAHTIMLTVARGFRAWRH